MNSKNIKTSDPYRLLKKVNNLFFYQMLAHAIHKKIQKNQTKPINLKCLLQRGIKILNYLIDHFLYEILKVVLSSFS